MKGAILALGILGGVFGLIGALFAIGLGGVGQALGSQNVANASKNGVIALLASIIGLVGTVLVYKNTKLAGWLMIGSAIVGFIAAFLAYIISAIFFLIAGIMALTIKQSKKNVETTST